MKTPLKVIFDSNVWISFAIGKRLDELKKTFSHQKIEIFVCQKLFYEVSKTIRKSKFVKYISPDRIQMLLEIMQACYWADIEEQISISRDPNDNFLLDLSETINADFLITGDNDLLVLKKHKHTNIISFNSFMAILETISNTV